MKTQSQQQGRLAMMTTLRTFPAMALGLLLLLLLGGPGLAKAQYVFTQIDVPGAVATYANGNITHEIVGEFDDEDGNTHGFVLSKGDFAQTDVPGADGYTSVNGINDKSDRVGIYFADDRFYGYFWRKGVFTTLDPSGSIFSVALFLNAKSQVAGYSRDAEGTRHGFVWRNGVFTTIDVPSAGPRGTRLSGINDSGQVVGGYSDKDQHLHGFLLSRGIYTTLDVPGSEGGFT